MSSSHDRVDESVSHETTKKPYTPPLLTRYGTVEELTQISTDAVSTGSGIPTDFSTAG